MNNEIEKALKLLEIYLLKEIDRENVKAFSTGGSVAVRYRDFDYIVEHPFKNWATDIEEVEFASWPPTQSKF